MLIRSNRFIFGNLLKFSKWEVLVFEKWILGKDKSVNVYVDVTKYNWSELR